jgi:putative transposase
MDERLKFIARLLDGEKMAQLCWEFGISRKTGYKILTRYNEIGLEGLTDRSRRPYRHANQLFQIETQIVRLKQDKPSWGAPKIRERLSRLYPDVHTPAISTVNAVLDRHGLVKRRTRRRNRATGTALCVPGQPNDLWCADHKGEFMLADRRYCYPPTITDSASRYVFACEALSTTKEAYAFAVFEAVFNRFGLPKAIRTDNGVPFASPNDARQTKGFALEDNDSDARLPSSSKTLGRSQEKVLRLCVRRHLLSGIVGGLHYGTREASFEAKRPEDNLTAIRGGGGIFGGDGRCIGSCADREWTVARPRTESRNHSR